MDYKDQRGVSILLIFTIIAWINLADAKCNSTTEFLCSNSNCIPLEKLNNTINDCGDNSDEAPIPCKAPLYSCRNNRCALQAWVLDGKNDCLDGSDETKYIGTNCTSAVTCCFCEDYVPNSKCTDGICQCSRGFYPNQLRNQCIRRILGHSCDSDSDCTESVEHSWCRGATSPPEYWGGVCSCRYGYYSSEDRFTCLIKRVGDDCHLDEDCDAAVNESLCLDDRCACRRGFQPSTDYKQCIPKILGAFCSHDYDCTTGIENSLCRAGNCSCVPGHRQYNHTTCIKRELGDDCDTDEDCTEAIVNSRCRNNSCSCQLGHKKGDQSESDVCVKRELGDDCDTDEDCTVTIVNSRCWNNSCSCQLGHKEGNQSDVCVKKILGDDCYSSADCQTVLDNSDCSGVCRCQLGFKNISVSDCIQLIIGDKCSADEACWIAVNKSECSNGTCSCLSGYKTTLNATDCQLRSLGDDCVIDSDCYDAINHTICDVTLNITCSCDEDHMPDEVNETCIPRPVLPQYIPDEIPVNNECIIHQPPTYSNWTQSVTTEADMDPDEGHSETKVENKLVRVKRDNCSDGGQAHTKCFSWGKYGTRCDCEGGYARKSENSPCLRSKGFLVSINCTRIAGRYYLYPLQFNSSFLRNNSLEYWIYTYRLQQMGIDKILENTTDMAEKFVTSRLLDFADAQPGVHMTVAVFMDYNSTINISDVTSGIRDFFDRYSDEIGNSRIFITRPFNESVTVEDLDECSQYLDDVIMNDCDPLPGAAECANVDGYFDCVCGMEYLDSSADSRYTGRYCSGEAKELKDAELEKAFQTAGCADGICETPWSLVFVVTGVIFSFLFLLLMVEVVCRTRQMRREVEAKRLRKPAVIKRTLIATVFGSEDSLLLPGYEDESHPVTKEQEQNIDQVTSQLDDCEDKKESSDAIYASDAKLLNSDVIDMSRNNHFSGHHNNDFDYDDDDDNVSANDVADDDINETVDNNSIRFRR